MPQSASPQKAIPPVLIQTAAIFLAVIILLEFVARMPWAQRTIPYRSVGNTDYQFEIKWFRLQEYVKQNGGVDVLILGSSVANTGVDPDVMAQVYYEQTGVRLRIFNFGCDGLLVTPNSINARILVNIYHPALLIYVTEMRDYIATLGVDYQEAFLSSQWVDYKQGNFDPVGWLIDHSMALQFYLPYRNWMRASFPETFYSYTSHSKSTTSSGYDPLVRVGENINLPPDPNNPDEANNFIANGIYEMAPSRLESLQSILALNQEGTPVLIVEMPVHPTSYAYLGGDEVHRQFQQRIASLVHSSGSSFLPAESCDDIPLIDRADRWHLNYLGAPVFSTCLAQQLADLAGQQNTSFVKLSTDNSK